MSPWAKLFISLQVEEGESLLIDLSAKANPPQIEYKWTNPDRLSVPEADDALPGTRDGCMNVVTIDVGDIFSKARSS